jgi:hypothetical protein
MLISLNHLTGYSLFKGVYFILNMTFRVLSCVGIKKAEFTPEEVDQYPEVPTDPMPQVDSLEIEKAPEDETEAINESDEETNSDDQPAKNGDEFVSFEVRAPHYINVISNSSMQCQPRQCVSTKPKHILSIFFPSLTGT